MITTINANAVGTNGSTIVTPSLTFKSSDVSDTGLYTCFAVNALGTGFSKETQLTVTGSNISTHSLNSFEYLKSFYEAKITMTSFLLVFFDNLASEQPLNMHDYTIHK